MYSPDARPVPGFQILTKHKEAIRQLHKFAKIGIQQLQGIITLVTVLYGASFNMMCQSAYDQQGLADHANP
jgi:hypothetical protein